jgi:GMP synthase (glutamine-hydrolysing)
MTDRVLILDFGSQVTQLIARRVRESGVYCEILPFNVEPDRIAAFQPRAVILSGGPASVVAADTPRAPDLVFDLGVPILGICYGQQTLCAQLGGEVEGSDHQEFGRACVEVTEDCGLTDGVWRTGERHQVWMSHGDRVVRLPEGFRVTGISDGAPYAVIADDARRIYGVQFHPEVVHTPDGARLLANFVHKVAGCAGDWTMAQFRHQAVEQVRSRVGRGKVVCGLSGGVDSSVAAVSRQWARRS